MVEQKFMFLQKENWRKTIFLNILWKDCVNLTRSLSQESLDFPKSKKNLLLISLESWCFLLYYWMGIKAQIPKYRVCARACASMCVIFLYISSKLLELHCKDLTPNLLGACMVSHFWKINQSSSGLLQFGLFMNSHLVGEFVTCFRVFLHP